MESKDKILLARVPEDTFWYGNEYYSDFTYKKYGINNEEVK